MMVRSWGNVWEVDENYIVVHVFRLPYIIYECLTSNLIDFVFIDLLPEFDSVDKTSPNCVIIGDAADKFSYKNLNDAFQVLIGMEKPVLFSLGRGYAEFCC